MEQKYRDLRDGPKNCGEAASGPAGDDHEGIAAGAPVVAKGEWHVLADALLGKGAGQIGLVALLEEIDRLLVAAVEGDLPRIVGEHAERDAGVVLHDLGRAVEDERA